MINSNDVQAGDVQLNLDMLAYKKEVSAERTFFGGKTGRTWYGFLCDWLTTLTGSKEIQGKTFSQRWSILSNAPITLKSVESGHDNARYFISKLVQELNGLIIKTRILNLSDYQDNKLFELKNKNHFHQEMKTLNFNNDLKSFIKNLIKFETQVQAVPCLKEEKKKKK